MLDLLFSRKPSPALIFISLGSLILMLSLTSSSSSSSRPAPSPPSPPNPPRPGPTGARYPARGPRQFSVGSTRHLDGVHPELVAVATRALETSGLDFAVTDGRRSVEEQQRLFDTGFSDCNPSAGCTGKHTTGRALDMAPIFDGQVELHSREKVRQLAPFVQAAADELGVPVKWLGDSTQFPDPFHWELLPSTSAPNVNGYRRARQDEVTPWMTEQAVAALSHSLGDVRGPFLNERGERFKVKLEVHSNAPKGSSVFLEDRNA